MKILIYTGYDSNPRYKEMGDASSFNKLQYAQKHGYDFLCERNYENFNRPISWFKIRKMLHTIDKYDWVFWTDADSLIINQDIKLEDIINSKGKEETTLRINEENIKTKLFPSENASFICSDDELGPCMANFFVKFTPDTVDFLSRVYGSTAFENHPWWDQGAAHHLWNTNDRFLSLLKVLPKNALHRAFHDYQDGDFIIHDKFHLENGKVMPK